MRIASTGHALFAAAMIILGIMGLVSGGFGPIWDSVPEAWPARSALAYLCDFICLACGVGLLLRSTAAIATPVVRPAISIKRRTRANNAACSGVGSGASVSVIFLFGTKFE